MSRCGDWLRSCNSICTFCFHFPDLFCMTFPAKIKADSCLSFIHTADPTDMVLVDRDDTVLSLRNFHFRFHFFRISCCTYQLWMIETFNLILNNCRQITFKRESFFFFFLTSKIQTDNILTRFLFFKINIYYIHVQFTLKIMKVLTRYSTLSKLDVPLHLGNRKEELRENPAMKLCHQYMPSYKL